LICTLGLAVQSLTNEYYNLRVVSINPFLFT
jgi:hypothetical protein